MKIFKYLFMVSFVLALTSCEDYFGDKANVDPDNPIVVQPSVILPQVQARLAYTYGGDFARYIGINTQHVDGVVRQFAVIGQYGIVPADNDTPWANIFNGVMGSNRQLKATALESGFNHYAGISLALEAYAMMAATDYWGDIPYSEAFRFDEGLLTPKFDSQESVYTAIFGLLDEARSLFASDNGGNAPKNDDLMNKGNIDKWFKFCNVLEARGRLHMSKIDAGAYSKVLAALAKGEFASAADQCNFQFGNAATENGPWYQYIEQRDDCETGATYKAMLQALNDPRDATYGWPHDNSHPIWTKDQTVAMLSFVEQEFMKAEALLPTDKDAAYAAYLSGIKQSLIDAKVEGYDDYIAQSAVGVGAANLTLANVMTQKYLAMYTDPEVFSDWRRTNLPALTPITGNAIPRRLPYAETEILANPNAPSPANVTIYSKVWWDQ